MRKGRDGAAQAVKAGATGTAVARILYLPEDLLEPMRVYRGAEGVTNTQLALRALNAHWRHIDELAARESSTRVVPGELFDEVLPTVRQARRQVEITPTGAQLEVIETTLAGTTARDRSHMFALAIRQLLTDAGVITPAT
ncbi:hypothetical protein [Intrasporangium sp.]|uniref:hypothetical protein n=1 Tax=Intrasporangium sp. TaxID=1925024 RepID=UPI0032215E93